MKSNSAPLSIVRGRQLFVDDALIECHNCQRVFHAAKIRPEPVLKPETPLELNGGECPSAAPFNDGVWYDPSEKCFRMYYQAGWFAGVALAFSEDGIHWTRPNLDVVPGTNLVLPIRPQHYRDGCLVWLDQQSTDPEERWKMFLYSRVAREEKVLDQFPEIYTSGDGIHWTLRGRTPACGDNSSFFYNAVRDKWAFSVRRQEKGTGRVRCYAEGDSFREAWNWDPATERFWFRADEKDLPDPDIDFAPQIYDVTAVGYESLLLGAITVMYGPENPECAERGIAKTIDLQLTFSRNGLDWTRPCREAFIPCSRQEGHWGRAYIHAAGGICCIVGDELYFYFTAFSGQSPTLSGNQKGSYITSNAMYAGASTGLATLRRDGFASMQAGSTPCSLTTPLILIEEPFLFVNADAAHGSLRVELLDKFGRPIPEFSDADALPLTGDGTCLQVQWKTSDRLENLVGEAVQFRFHLQNASLYSFWTSPDEDGSSGGFTAAGGPGLEPVS